MDFKKLLQHIDNIEKPKKQLNEASMNISFNADTADEVGAMLDRLKGVATSAPAPVQSNMGADMQKFKAALGGMEGPPAPPAIANAPEEEYSGVDAVTGSGDDIHKSKNPADIRVKDPSISHEIKDWANEPEEKLDKEASNNKEDFTNGEGFVVTDRNSLLEKLKKGDKDK